MARSKHFRSHGKDLLFPLKGGFQLVKVGRLDACTWNDNIRDLEQLIYASQDMYPGIEHKFKEKVIPGLRSSERIAYLAYENNKPIASAVLKRGAKSKICHLKIHRDFQDLHLG